MKTMKKVSKLEKDIANKVGGKRCICSGAKWFMKSDIQSDKLQIEVKTSFKEGSGIVIKKKWLDKLAKETKNTGRIPVLCCKTNSLEAYLVKPMYLNMYNKSYIVNSKYPVKLSSSSYYVDDTDLLLDFGGDKWVVMSEEEMVSFVNEVRKVDSYED